MSYRRNLYDGKAVFVGHITLVKGVPFFGYHVGYRYFLKIYMLNPLNMTRFADLLYQGAIMHQVLQPFEGHLQYLLQWMCDYNLYGCSYIDCKAIKFRSPVPEYLEMNSTKHKWHDRTITQDIISDPDEFPRQSHCSIEVDVCVQDILNRSQIEDRNIHANFIERFAPVSPDEKLVHSLAGLWKDETRRRKRRMGMNDNTSSPFPAEVLVSMSADIRNTEKGGWIHEEEYRERVMHLIEEERSKREGEKPSFGDFVKPLADENSVQTTLNSVEDLFPEKLQQQTPLDLADVPGQVIVDESTIPKFDDDDFPYDSDEEVAREIALTQKKRTEDVAAIRKMDDAPQGEADEILAPPSDDPSSAPLVEECNDAQLLEEQKLAISDGMPERSPSARKRARLRVDAEGAEAHVRSTGIEGHQKRRRLNQSTVLSPDDPDITYGSLQSLPGSGPKANLVDNANTDGIPNGIHSGSSPRKRSSTGTPSNSQQLSQGSIKAVGTAPTQSLSFPVVKHPHESGPRYLSQRHDNDVTPAKKTPSKSISTAGVPPVTPWSKKRTASTNYSPLLASGPVPQKVTQLASHYGDFQSTRAQRFVFGGLPPSAQEVSCTLFDLGLPPVIYQDAFYSFGKDVPDRARDYAGREFKLESITTPYLSAFDSTSSLLAAAGDKLALVLDPAKEELNHLKRRQRCRLRHWEIEIPAPSWTEVKRWLQAETPKKLVVNSKPIEEGQDASGSDQKKKGADLSQIEGPTQRSRHGFKFSQKQKSTSVQHETQYMSTMSLEVHVNSRADLAPNPEDDEIACVFWCIKSDDDETTSSGTIEGLRIGILTLAEDAASAKRVSSETPIPVEHETNELDLINRIVDLVREYDPDILTGYEVHNGSWGYLIERARLKYEYNLCDEFSRMLSQSHGRFGKDADRWGFNHTSTIRVTGRHMINVWRAMRSELNLLQYTMENVVFHLLHKRIPHYPFKDLTRWYTKGTARDLAKVIEYFVSRVKINLEILDANELIPRTSEQARLIGVDFFSVFSRGSQFKVESFMFRIAKPENFLLVSPSRKQVGQQNALECLPLVMEPQSAFYSSPVLVLDFQSLYPSIMIAYNYCYSTCLGRVVGWRGQNKMGFADFKRQPGLLGLVKDSINIAPNGIMYVKPEMRKSLLAKMLGEILETRVMVKSGMKVDKKDKTLQQLLNNRQLALKLLANVTYGYTSASFSGRMPCSEIADSIVQTGRETLERAIALIHSVEKWGAEVVYGDTDSLFVHLKGRTRAQAFTIGTEIAAAITSQNPRPIKLKFEKVYHPCVLLAKKRYVGFKYESPAQTEPAFDAKGIETVRRDGTPAEQKIEEKALKILFRTADLSQVKRYFLHQCDKIMRGRVSIQDFCFAREVKLGTYADKGPPPPGALISTRRMLADPRAEPQYGERVPYVVVTGAPGARLIDRCVAPETLLMDEGADLDAEYYISKNLIPPLERIFNLVGANVRQWFDDMPKTVRVREVGGGGGRPGSRGANAGPVYAPNGQVVQARKTLEGYMKTSHCVVCRTKLPAPAPGQEAPLVPLCAECLGDAPRSLYTLRMRLREAEAKAVQVEKVCRSCAGLTWGEEVRCDSKDCPVFYTRVRARVGEGRVRGVVEGAGAVLEELDW